MSPTKSTMPSSSLRGLVLEIQRMSTEDGPGLRTTVFMKGCPLRCRWCHNPESLKRTPEVQWTGSRCIHCGLCETVCERQAIQRGPVTLTILRDRCTGCGTCAAACPTTAMEVLGTWWTAKALADEVAKDEAYFRHSGGGVTFSGGEPTLQAPFIEETARELARRGVSAALDTCGLVSFDILERLTRHVSLILYDVKVFDSHRHRALTGADNPRILDNLRKLAYLPHVQSGTTNLWVRTPIVPSDTDTVDNIRRIAEFLCTLPPEAISRWDLCSFNHLCQDKYLRLGQPWPYADTPLKSAQEMNHLRCVAVSCGFPADRVFWSGTVRSSICAPGRES